MKKIPALSRPAASGSEATPSATGSNLESPALPAIVAKAFGRLNNRLRARMLRRLLTSVGPLALTVVGGGVFAKYLRHARWSEIPVSMEDAARSPHTASVRSSVLAPFQTICTPMQSRMNAVRRSRPFIPASPIILLSRSA